jgi:hypothetical protein
MSRLEKVAAGLVILVLLAVAIFLLLAGHSRADEWPPMACAPQEDPVVCGLKVQRNQDEDELVRAFAERRRMQAAEAALAQWWAEYASGAAAQVDYWQRYSAGAQEQLLGAMSREVDQVKQVKMWKELCARHHC